MFINSEAELSWTMLCPRRIRIDYHGIASFNNIDILRESSRGWDLIHIRASEGSKAGMENAVMELLKTDLGKFEMNYELQVIDLT